MPPSDPIRPIAASAQSAEGTTASQRTSPSLGGTPAGTAAAPRGVKSSVLIVEDDDKFRQLVELRLRSWREDLDIHFAENLARARNLLDDSSIRFTLVILDQHLPDGIGSELFLHPRLRDAAVLAVSADDSPEIPGRAVIAGAQHFLGKRQITEPLFIPLLEALIERKSLESELLKAKLKEGRLDTIRVLLGTLRHEINNPLGAVLGGAYLLRSGGNLAEDQHEALRLIEASGNRIKHVMSQLCETAELQEVTKGQERMFQVPGDPSWKPKGT